MRSLINQYTGFRYLLFLLVNTAGQLLEAHFLFTFLRHIFRPHKGEGKVLWPLATLLMTIFTLLSDVLSHNETNVWMAVVIGFPFLVLLLFCQGDVRDKLVHCLLCADILLSLESVCVSLTNIVLSYRKGPYAFLLFLYICRRCLMKLLLLFALRFLWKSTKTTEYSSHRLTWYVLGLLSVAELLLLSFMREQHRSSLEQLPLELFCVFTPLLFYVTLNLLEDAFRRDKVALMLQAQLDAQQQYLEGLGVAQESLRRFRHDYQAHLLCMDALLEEGKKEELRSYLSSLHGKDLSLGTYISFSQNGLLNALLNQKRALSSQRGVDLDILVVDIPLKGISAYDLNVLLTNLLDNAIEAASSSEDKKVRLRMGPNRDYLEIKVYNSTSGNILKENPRFFTSKKDAANHGYGMKIIQSLVQKQEGIMKMDAGEDWFETRLLLLNEM